MSTIEDGFGTVSGQRQGTHTQIFNKNLTIGKHIQKYMWEAEEKAEQRLKVYTMCITTIKWRGVTDWFRDKTEPIRRVNKTREF